MSEYYISAEGDRVEQLKQLVYYGSLFKNDGTNDRDIEKRVNAAIRIIAIHRRARAASLSRSRAAISKIDLRKDFLLDIVHHFQKKRMSPSGGRAETSKRDQPSARRQPPAARRG
ncbi:hypothetical protein EVAR_24231_1 [Eumeta japonica]|uniref:Uncharacterized protein n=1 Tax=Eumeta variegata TaxID=151549 RepID=A0A4C1W7G1_EUMVA|nr:hypothetical protein EVAR_24231_1 [Eumeta japonica]